MVKVLAEMLAVRGDRQSRESSIFTLPLAHFFINLYISWITWRTQ